MNAALETKNLTLDTALEIATGMELSSKDAAQLQNKGGVNAITGTKKKDFKRGNRNTNTNSNSNSNSNSNTTPAATSMAKGVCYRCGSPKHFADKCDKKNLVCSSCHVQGHLAKVCRKAKTNTNAIDAEDSEVDEVVKVVDAEEHAKFRQKFHTKLLVNDVPVQFEVDSGASVTIMGKKQFKCLFPNAVTTSTNVKLVTYCRQSLEVLGFLPCDVSYQNTKFVLNLYVVSIDREPLLGREWIRQLKLGLWDTVQQVGTDADTDEALQSLLTKYAVNFQPGIGNIKGVQARLTLKPGAQPVFVKARPVPFALMPKIEKELDDLVEQGIPIKVDSGDWGTPVVPVVKGNGRIRVCGDFKITINPWLQVDEHPLPTNDELFATMAGGQKFSKIDLSWAYLHFYIFTFRSSSRGSRITNFKHPQGVVPSNTNDVRSCIRSCYMAARDLKNLTRNTWRKCFPR